MNSGIRVECYAGHRGEEEPRRIFLGERGIAVLEVLDRCPHLRETDLPWEGVCTNYEDKFVSRGAHINRLALEKAGASGRGGRSGSTVRP